MNVYIKETAKANGVSIQELANRLRVSRQTVHYYCEQGDKNPLGQLAKIADAIGVPVSALFGDAPEPFLAIVRKNGETHTFEEEGELRAWLAVGEHATKEKEK